MAFTPIDLISSLASLNKGDIQGFRQPWSKEGRQQTLTERQQQTQLLQQHQAILDHINSLPVEERPGAVENYSKVLGNRALNARLPFVGQDAEAELRAKQAGTRQTEQQTTGMQAQQGLAKQSIDWFNDPAVQAFLRSQAGAPATTGNMPPQAFGELSGLQQKEKQLQIEKEHMQMLGLTSAFPFISQNPAQADSVMNQIKTLGGVKPGGSPTTDPRMDELQRLMREFLDSQNNPPPGPIGKFTEPAIGSVATPVALGAAGYPQYHEVMNKLEDLTPLVQQLMQTGANIPQGTSNEDLKAALVLIQRMMQPEQATHGGTFR